MAASESQPVKTKKRRASMCVGCGGQITDQYILRVAPDLEWHASCLKCTDCSVYLDETCTCFVRDGKTYCKRDYVRLFGTKCARCGQGFSKTDFVMRAKNKIYHINCFRCVACSRELIPGDEFALREDGLFCKADHDIVESASSGSRTPTGGLMEDSKLNVLNNNNNDTKNGMHPTGSEGSPPGSGGSTGSKGIGHGSGNRGSRHKSDQKTTRVRTVLNEKQLHTLRTCYSANPRPDALMKEQLVEMTGLSPRVIRVWFQNKRCKDKKKSILMKQMQQQQQDKNGLCDADDLPSSFPAFILRGVPMVASSPVRHEPPPNMQPAPVEVQQYQAPWKALTEFAMQSDLDQPPFQQLMHSFDLPPGCREPLPPMYGPPGGHLLMADDHLFNRPSSAGSDNTIPGTSSELSSPGPMSS